AICEGTCCESWCCWPSPLRNVNPIGNWGTNCGKSCCCAACAMPLCLVIHVLATGACCVSYPAGAIKDVTCPSKVGIFARKADGDEPVGEVVPPHIHKMER